MKLNELAKTVRISEEKIEFFLHDVLKMKKLSARGLPRLLTVDLKQHRVDDLTAVLTLLKRNQAGFFCRFVTMDKTWSYYNTSEPKR